MAETSGFFDAVYDEEAKDYDLKYLASQFAGYFSQFIGNGVFGSPTNQLRVSTDETTMTVSISSGAAFIDGYWYKNDETLSLTVPTNLTSQIRTDSVRCRYSTGERKISVVYVTDSIEPVRNSEMYDLILAQVIVQPASTSISTSDITDTRTNEDLCGFVKGLLEVEPTKDLFAQYNAIFMEWFNNMKDQLSEDAAGNLQNQIGNLADLETNTKSNLVAAVDEVNRNAGSWIGPYSIDAGRNSFKIQDSRIKTTSVIELYYNENSLQIINDLDIKRTLSQGSLTLEFGEALSASVIIDNVNVINPVKNPLDEIGAIGLIRTYSLNYAISGAIEPKEVE